MSANWIPLELLLSSGVAVRIVFALRDEPELGLQVVMQGGPCFRLAGPTKTEVGNLDLHVLGILV